MFLSILFIMPTSDNILARFNFLCQSARSLECVKICMPTPKVIILCLPDMYFKIGENYVKSKSFIWSYIIKKRLNFFRFMHLRHQLQFFRLFWWYNFATCYNGFSIRGDVRWTNWRLLWATNCIQWRRIQRRFYFSSTYWNTKGISSIYGVTRSCLISGIFLQKWAALSRQFRLQMNAKYKITDKGTTVDTQGLIEPRLRYNQMPAILLG